MPANTLQKTKHSSPQSLREVWLALVGLSAVFLFEMLDNSILNIALPVIGRELHASASSLQWITSAYAIVFGGFMLAFGAMADKFGRRKLMLIGLVILGLASLATLLVQNASELIAIRMIMGIAAAMTTPGTIAMAFVQSALTSFTMFPLTLWVPCLGHWLLSWLLLFRRFLLKKVIDRSFHGLQCHGNYYGGIVCYSRTYD